MTTLHLRDSINCAPLRRGFFLITCGIFAAVLLLGLSPAIATAPQSSVRGQGQVQLFADTSVSHISVNAWRDANGAHGTVLWIGGVGPGTVPPAFPWQLDVTDITFNGHTAHVTGVVVHSPVPADIGTVVPFVFTDNNGTGAPDEIAAFDSGSIPITAGNIIVQ